MLLHGQSSSFVCFITSHPWALLDRKLELNEVCHSIKIADSLPFAFSSRALGLSQGSVELWVAVSLYISKEALWEYNCDTHYEQGGNGTHLVYKERLLFDPQNFLLELRQLETVTQSVI